MLQIILTAFEMYLNSDTKINLKRLKLMKNYGTTEMIIEFKI